MSKICDDQRFEKGARVSKRIPTTHAFLHQITYSKLWRAASGIRARIAAVFLQMHNISSANLLWDKKNVEKGKLMSLLIILPWKG